MILASASPRRRELLGEVFAEFEIVAAHLDEEALSLEDPWETAIGLARAKAEVVALGHPDAMVIGADTVVTLDGQQFAKPNDPADATRMLASFSGRTHQVITGLALVIDGVTNSFHDTTQVTFKTLTKEEIASYVSTEEPYDKAGGYAIQGGAAPFVASYEGSLSNVIGLPMERFRELLHSLPSSLDQ